MKPILEIRNIWKQYKIGGQKASYLSLRERLTQGFRGTEQETFWALQDINFDVFEGECIGIIGSNGAGKSTLLKILSQITPPTKGYIKARGRIASLLEVGTGFHPELTGRENVYLNGSILGLRRSEINTKFDEIIDFSGVEKFLDTPLKHYSSGMRLRLAFSVAAYLEPEILLIDEVLAVGDAAFQKKCLGKMDEVSKSGRTVLFVSHNLGAVRQLCSRGVVVEHGTIVSDTDTETSIRYYLNKQTSNINSTFLLGTKEVTIEKIMITDFSNQRLSQDIISGTPIKIHLHYVNSVKSKISEFHIGLAFYNEQGQFITVLNNKMNGQFLELNNRGTITIEIEKLPFMFGRYNALLTSVVNGRIAEKIDNAISINVLEGDFYNSGFSNTWGRKGIFIKQDWSVNESN